MGNNVLNGEGYYMIMKKLKYYIDGSCRPNPGTMGACVTDDSGEVCYLGREGQGTNNKSEYTALKRCLEYNLNKGVMRHGILIHTDSQLLDGHLNKDWSVKANNLKDLYKEVVLLMDKLTFERGNIVKIIKIPRSQNKADRYLDMLFKED